MRLALEECTARTHAQLDSAMSELSLGKRVSFVTFLRTHHLAYRALLPLLPNHHWITDVVDEMTVLLAADLDMLGAVGATRPMIAVVPQMHPLGVAYVVCGSHFGKRVLRRRWHQSTDPAVLDACSYLDSEALAKGWGVLLEELSNLEDPAHDLAVLAADADRTFSIFYDSLLTVKNWELADAAA